MAEADPGDVTRLLNAVRVPAGGPDDPGGAGFERVYADLKTIAGHLLARESDRGVLQTTVLVHEALLRLRQFEADRPEWANRGHFFACAARAMRRILVEEARRRKAHRKSIVIVEQFVVVAGAESRPIEIDLLNLDEAIVALEEADPALCEIISLKVFGEQSAASIGEIIGQSEDQVRRKMRLAQAWLIRWLRDHGRLPGLETGG